MMIQVDLPIMTHIKQIHQMNIVRVYLQMNRMGISQF